MNEVINSFSINIYPTVQLKEKDKLSELLNAFETKKMLIPTHWGNSEKVRVEYNREEILDKLFVESKVSVIYLSRKDKVNYTGDFGLNLSPRTFIDFNFDITNSSSEDLWLEVFQLSDQIAEIVKPRWGVSTIGWPAKYPWSSEVEKLHVWMDLCSQPVPVKFLPSGPLGLGSRTYIGGHILDLFGREFIENAPGIVTELAWGGFCIDIVDHPWRVSLDEYMKRWIEMMKYFESANVMAIPFFEEDCMSVSFSPNTEWRRYLKDS